MPMQITIDELKWFLIEYQGLGSLKKYERKSGVIDFMNQVGCIQYDPLNVVGRNSDLVLQSRVKDYDSSILEELLYKDRILVDGWDKQMSIYKTSDWSKMKRVREAMALSTESTLKKRKSHDALKHIDAVKDALKETGPTRPSGIELGQVERGVWGHGKISSVVLDYLFHKGAVGIHSKSGTQKIYDFIENLMQSDVIQSEEGFESEEAFMDWYVKRRIGSIGMYWAKRGDGWLGKYLSVKEKRTESINRLVEAGDLHEVEVESIDDKFYIRREDMPLLKSLIQSKSSHKPIRTNGATGNTENESGYDPDGNLIHRCNEEGLSEDSSVRFIAPLDNLIWDRKLIKDVFNFDYVWEVYKPVSERRFGYYVLPVLYKNNFVGRFEPDHLRGGNVLRIKNWWWEEDTLVDDALRQTVVKGFEDFARYLGVEKIDADFEQLLK